jgi:tetratricopeptide (TPR) repeat protein
MASLREREVEAIAELANQRKYDEALELGQQLLTRYPDEPSIHANLGFVHAMRKDYREAVREITQALRLAPDEPAFLFDRASWQLELGMYREVLDDSSAGIASEREHQRSYYSEALWFCSAIARVHLRDPRGGLDDCAQIKDGGQFWALGRNYTKEELLQEFRRQLAT